jgi:hypothetical protein
MIQTDSQGVIPVSVSQTYPPGKILLFFFSCAVSKGFAKKIVAGVRFYRLEKTGF